MQRSELMSRLKALKPWLSSQGVASVRVFGSHARNTAAAESDIDLIVSFHPDREPDLFSFAGLRLDLEERLGAKVDLFTPRSLHPALRQRIEAMAIDA